MAQLDFLTFLNQLTWLLFFFSIFYYLIRSKIIIIFSTLYGLRNLLKNPENLKNNNALLFANSSLVLINKISLKTYNLSKNLNNLSIFNSSNVSLREMFQVNKKTYQ